MEGVPEQVIVVHVVGESDTGLSRLFDRPVDARQRRLSRWRQVLAESADDAMIDILRHGWDGDLGAGQHTPLAGLIAVLDQPIATLLLVAGPSAARGVPSAPIADGLRGALTRIPTAFGPAVTDTALVTAAGFDDDAVADKVCAAVEEHAGDVVLTWGSGSTGIALAALAGIVQSGRGWVLRQSRAPFRAVDLLPAEPVDARARWLLRLGYPSQVLALAGTDRAEPQLLDYARQSQERTEKVLAGDRSADALAEVVRAELRRRDGTSGIAVRAWLEARYRKLLHQDRGRSRNLTDLLGWARREADRTGRVPMLGHLIDIVERNRHVAEIAASASTPSGTWLTGFAKRINASASASAHRWIPLPDDIVRDIDTRLPQRRPDDRHYQLARALGPSAGIVQVVWGVGKESTDRPSYAETLMASALPAAVLHQTGRSTQAEVTLSATLLTSSPESAAFATKQVEFLAATGGGPYRSVRTQVVAIGNDPAGKVDPAAAQAELRHVLAGQNPQPDVVVVTPTGTKESAAATFAAALEYGQAKAIPVLVECTDLDRVAVSYHRVGGYLGMNHIVSELAVDAAMRLELDTAARLLALGTVTHPELSTQCFRLADAIRAALAGPGADPRPVLAVLQHATGHELDQWALLRLAYLAGTCAPSRSTLSRLRNQLPVAHGTHALADLLEKAGARDVQELIARELGAGAPTVLADEYARLLQALHRRVADDAALRGSTGIP